MREITSLDELKEIELSIMKEIHRFCVDNKIEYYLSYGTLLGAIRHDGFIPWDDDIDIQMFRDDYEKFITLFNDHASVPYLKLVNSKTKPYFGRNMSKVIDTRTTLIEKLYKDNDDIGVFVDIWPIDGTPNNKIYRKMIVFICKLLSKMQLASSSDFKLEKSLARKIMVILCNIIPSKKLIKMIDKIALMYDPRSSDFVHVYCGVEDPMDKRAYNSVFLHNFEDASFFIPTGFDYILHKTYGDYMKLPDEEKRVPHHVMDIFFK